MHEREPRLQVEPLSEREGIWPFRKRRYVVYKVDKIDEHGMTHRTEVLDGEFRNRKAALRAAEKIIRTKNKQHTKEGK